MVQLSDPYMFIGKTIALTVWNFVSRVMCLLLNTLSVFVIVILPRSITSSNFMAAIERLLLSCERRWDSWPPEERDSIWC